MTEIKTGSDSISRAAIKQIVWLTVVAVASFIALMAVLSWASNITGGGAESFSAVDYKKGAITLILADEPPQMDTTRSTDQISFFILGHVTEGLLRYDEKNRIVPGVAERWEIRA